MAGGDFLVKDLMEDFMVDLVLHFFLGGFKKTYVPVFCFQHLMKKWG